LRKKLSQQQMASFFSFNATSSSIGKENGHFCEWEMRKNGISISVLGDCGAFGAVLAHCSGHQHR